MGGKTQRILTMLNLIPRSPAKISVTRLQGYLQSAGYEVTARTIQRDLQEASRNNPLVLDDRDKPFGWSYVSDDIDRSKDWHVFEALSLVIACQEFGHRLPSAITQYLAPKEREAKRVLGQFSDGLVGFSEKVANVPRGFQLLPAQVERSILDAVYDGLLRELQLQIDYGEKKNIRVHPVGLVFRDQVSYLLCTYWDYSDIRQLALHRIGKCTVAKEKAKRPEGFSLQDYEQSGALGYLKSDATIELVLRMKKPAASHLRETPISIDQKIVEYGEKWETVTASVQDRVDLVWWILGFGGWVEVIAPPELRRKVARAASNMNKMYQD